MKFFVVFSCLLAVAFAKPGFLAAPAVAILPGAPLGPDGRVVDTAEVTLAKAEHAAAHINERHTLNKEALRSADYVVAAAPAIAAAPALAYTAPVAAAPALAYSAPIAAAPALAYSAPIAAAPLAYATPYAHHAGVIGADGRPLDTAEVALAKAAHASAHLNERLLQAHEAARNYYY